MTIRKKGVIVGFFGGRFVTPFAPTGFRLEGAMNLTRRQFIALMSSAAAAGLLPRASFATGGNFYDFHFSGNVRLLHFTDCHAQLMPIYFREPNANIGIGEASGRVPHLVGTHLLKRYPQLTGSYAHALTYLNFTESARRYGKVGGFAHLATLVKQLRPQPAKTVPCFLTEVILGKVPALRIGRVVGIWWARVICWVWM